jgi:molybdenum cofactor cytidylyltransferase
MGKKSQPNSFDPVPIVLAGGKGNRFDGIKQLASIEGKPLIQYVLASVKSIEWRYKPIVILGYRAERIINSIDPDGFRLTMNEAWREGMSTSLKRGIKEAPRGSSGYLVYLADMPLIKPTITREVLEKASSGASIVAPVFQDVRGFPVYLSRKWRAELLEGIDGDKGARELINRHREEFVPVRTEDRGVIMDLNEKDDIARIKSYLAEEGTEIGF